MRKLITFAVVLSVFGLFLSVPASFAGQSGTATEQVSNRSHKFSFGFRWKYWEQTNDKAFIGTITDGQVDERIKWYPTNFNMQFLLNDYLGFVAEFDHFSSTMEKDGVLNWQVVTVGVTARYPMGKRFVPYAVLGVTWNHSSFNENNWWRYGFPGNNVYDDYMATRPADRTPLEWMQDYNHIVRNMKTDDAYGYTFGAGVDVFVWKNMAINFDVRWNKAQTDANYTIAGGDGHDITRDTDFTYDLDTLSWSLGLRWFF